MKVLCFGEVLWDIFSTEKKIGGAPFNFAAHLVKNGVDAAICSAVGMDALGQEALQRVTDLQVDTKYIATVAGETGQCLVTLQNGTPNYNIKMNTAMDMIPEPCIDEPFDALYFGTLAQRCPTSRETLATLLKRHRFAQVFVDVNIRQHYYDRETLESSIAAATILKISREELPVLGEVGLCDATAEYGKLCAALCAAYPGLQTVIITLDADGAYVYADGREYRSRKPDCQVVSTVGAGDSFSAAFLAAVLQGKDVEQALDRATCVSEYVVTQLGAIPEYPPNLI